MERRQFLASSATMIAAAAFTKSAFAADKAMEHHHHGGAKNSGLVSSAYNCVEKGEACIQHCVEMLSGGDTSFKECAKEVRNMLVYCHALAAAAQVNSKQLKSLAKICIDACSSCEEACKKHKDMPECTACAEACADCIKECKKIA